MEDEKNYTVFILSQTSIRISKWIVYQLQTASNIGTQQQYSNRKKKTENRLVPRTISRAGCFNFVLTNILRTRCRKMEEKGNNTVFWDMMLCRVVYVYRLFRDTPFHQARSGSSETSACISDTTRGRKMLHDCLQIIGVRNFKYQASFYRGIS